LGEIGTPSEQPTIIGRQPNRHSLAARHSLVRFFH
jgi:hypothetical protein